ncbi:MAG TPA: type II secretion system protein N [Gammaproteobacteria bacterium]|nr:type II secretion system protein N [Gammaproteobacteria bacterium]
MTRRVLRWLVPGLLAYLIFLCASFPAVYAWHWLQPDLPNVRLSAVSGSIWSGQAGQLSIESVPLGAVKWRFDWRALLSGAAGYRLHLGDDGLQLVGRAAVSHGQRIVIHDLSGRIPVRRLDHWLPLPAGSLDGVLDLDLQTLVFSKGLPQAADGRVVLDQASLNWPQTAVLGSYRMQLHTDKGIIGDIRDSSGPLLLQARVTLQTGGQYRVQGTLSARDTASAAARLLDNLGGPDSAGKHTFDFTGHLQ